MEEHLKTTCPQRRARCQFCNKEFSGHVFEVIITRYYCSAVFYTFFSLEPRGQLRLRAPILREQVRRQSAQETLEPTQSERLFETPPSVQILLERIRRRHTFGSPLEMWEGAGGVSEQMRHQRPRQGGSRTHLKEECTVSVLSCTYKDAGCRFKVIPQISPVRAKNFI
jgi:TNF receptor-associated factor 4